jgi:hypothetical protein
MIEVTVIITQQPGQYVGTRKKTFLVEAPEIDEYILFCESQAENKRIELQATVIFTTKA